MRNNDPWRAADPMTPAFQSSLSRREYWSRLLALLEQGNRVFIALVVGNTPHSPGTTGARLMVWGDGRTAGTVGGGVMELELVVRARRVLAGQAFEPEIVTLHHRKTGEGTKSGMICSGSQTNLYFLCDPVRDLPPITEAGKLLESGSPGRLSLGRAGFSVRACEPDLSRSQLSLDAASSEWVYTEELFNRKRIAIIGGGHCSVALSRVMRQLDYDVLVYDTREQVATAQTNPFANHLEVVSDYRETGGRIPFPEATPVVVMTSDFKSDSRGLRGALDHPFPFVGVMGSRSKIKAIFECLRGEGVADERLADLKAPVGLPMRSGTPEEIAVSVAAQILREL